MSATHWLQRVGRMDRAEIVFRARVAAREHASRLAGAWRPRRWHREALAPLLARSAGPLDSAIERLEARDWSGAHEALSEHFHRRVSRFPVSPHALPELADRIRRRFPDAAAEAASAADRIASGRFALLGYDDVSFASGDRTIDWHYDPVHDRHAPRAAWWSGVRYLDPAYGDHKIIWELNRHQHFLALGRAAWLTGDGRYRDIFALQLEDWLHSNPPLAGINWASMLELSLRSLSWLWALHLFVESPSSGDAAADAPWLLDLLLALDRQLGQVEQNLSRYFSPNTHLTGEALGLYACGRSLPELSSAPRWEATGREVLLEQIDRQIGADGGHAERSTHYHRYTLDFYLLALVIARSTEDPCVDRFEAAVERLAEAARILVDGEGRLARIGDDDGGSLFPICGRPTADLRDSLASAAAVLGRPDLAIGPTPEETMWLLGNQPTWMIARKRRAISSHADLTASAALPDTGYFVSRPRAGDHIIVDGGPHGFMNGGHAHADALSLTATLSGQPLLIDPGTATYTMSPSLRDRFRSSQMHNTLTLDGRSQSMPRGPFHWQSVANGRPQRWVATPLLDYFEGVQDGYLPAVHRRRVLTAAGGSVLVVDTVFGDPADHRADVHWHLDPAWLVEGVERGALSLRRTSGERAWFLTLGGQIEFHAGDDEGLGWCSPAYGRVEPAMTLQLHAEGKAPLLLVTLFGEGTRAAAPSLRRIAASTEAEGTDALALELDGGDFTDLLIFGYRQPVLPDGAPAERQRATRLFGHEGRLALVRAGGIETDARLLCMRRTADGEVAWMAILDGRSARDLASERVLWSSSEPNDDLVIEAPSGRPLSPDRGADRCVA